ncbi:MAG: hypothetical protein ABI921_08355 [Panacibacter sp.]
MTETIVSFMFIVGAVYMLAGILFTIFFQAKGLSKIDEGTHGAGIGFRIIILPGIIVFWPFLLRKWIKAKDNIIDQT